MFESLEVLLVLFLFLLHLSLEFLYFILVSIFTLSFDFFFLQREFEFASYRPLTTQLDSEPFQRMTWDVFASPGDKSVFCTPTQKLAG